MQDPVLYAFIADRFAKHHKANPCIDYDRWHSVPGAAAQPLATLGCRGADEGPLFLEAYLHQPVERIVSTALDEAIDRANIVEIGCLAAMPSPALLTLWCRTAATLSNQYEVAVATLTRPLRQMFGRVGLPFVQLVAADASRLGPDAARDWGSYYNLDPVVCAGRIEAWADVLTRLAERVGRAASVRELAA
ncbi:MAG: hypothetical protein JWQ16_980 [Novosphingobium sp.]|nr:hypothetical protein [Novosphingobium sp.]